MRKRLGIYIFFLLALLSAGSPLFGQTEEIESRKQEIKNIEADIKYLDDQILSTRKQQKNSLDELVLLQSKISTRKKLLSQLDYRIASQTKEISRTQREVSALEKRLDTLEHYYRKMVYNAYKHRDTKTWFLYILASKNFDQGYRRWSYLKNYSRTMSAQAGKIREVKAEHLSELKKLEQLKRENLTQKKDRQKEFDKLAAEEKQSKAFIKSLDKKQSQYKQRLATKKKEAARLEKEVEKMIAAEIKRQQELARKAKKAEDAKKANVARTEDLGKKEFEEYTANTRLSGGFSINRGNLPFPVAKGVIVEKFGVHPHPTLKNVKLPFNNGINISTTPGSSVKAVFDGVVKQVIAIPGYNQCVLIQHGQYFTFYCKLAKVSVKVGEQVTTGAVLGSLESDGSTATLHFELWNGTTKQNPELWLKK